ncbi:translation initiation factor IF-2-like [Ursus maritimus]|uniref:Translation initiation factor IF-2-like n=1 Tax=Ursus maritimus TaxID=29073 RepID=A0A8M1H591_URSMA|nr:translation initiation factor IF-2-like [Ursus maritimus]
MGASPAETPTSRALPRTPPRGGGARGRKSHSAGRRVRPGDARPGAARLVAGPGASLPPPIGHGVASRALGFAGRWRAGVCPQPASGSAQGGAPGGGGRRGGSGAWQVRRGGGGSAWQVWRARGGGAWQEPPAGRVAAPATDLTLDGNSSHPQRRKFLVGERSRGSQMKTEYTLIDEQDIPLVEGYSYENG